jgi:hypothetical protein
MAAYLLPIWPLLWAITEAEMGFFGEDGAWWLIILLLFANNGWGKVGLKCTKIIWPIMAFLV